jgi:hypothetical protein
MAPLLELKDVHTYYGGVHALRGVSLKVEQLIPDEAVLIPGPIVGQHVFVEVFEFELRMSVSARDQPPFQNAANACVECSMENDGRELTALNLEE